jgi:hypothetical protein
MIKYLFTLSLSLLILTGCKKDVIPTTADVTKEEIGSVTVNNIAFNFLTAKGQLEMDDKGETNTSGYSLRVKKDSIIWMSVQPGLGIEAARIKITQDSVYFMNRLQKEYAATDFDFLSDRFNVDINFNILQAILLGNFTATGQEKVMNEEGVQHIQQIRADLLLDYFINKKNNKLEQFLVQDQETGNTITVKYDAFQPVGTIPFAHKMAAQILQKGEVSSFKLDHSKVTVTDEPQSFPFTVPAGYKRL